MMSVSFNFKVIVNANSDYGLSFTSSVAKCHSMVPIVMKLILHHLGTAIFDLMTSKQKRLIMAVTYTT